MAPSHVTNQGGRSYPCSRGPHHGPVLCLRVRCRRMDAKPGSFEPKTAFRHRPSQSEVSAHLVFEAPSLRAKAVSASLEMGLVGRLESEDQGEAEPLPSDFTRRDYPIRVSSRHGGKRRSGRVLRISFIHVRSQRFFGRSRAFPAIALSLARKIRPIQSMGEYELRLPSVKRRLRLGRLGV